MIERIHLQQLKARVSNERKFIQVLTGPRQVGKTTAVQQLLDWYSFEKLSISADGAGAAGKVWLEQQWEAARIRWKQSGSPEFLLVIDEIQKIGDWSETVKKLWDDDTLRHRNIKVILLGSSRLLIQNGLSESLAGRFETLVMGHWNFEEMHAAFGWTEEQFVWFGGYPGSAVLIGDEKRWKHYVKDALIETSISKDILMMTRINKPALLRQLFEIACHYSGQIMSFNKMLGQLNDAGNTTTLSHYLSTLQSAGLIAGLEKYSTTPVRKKSSSPKFQVYNTALISSQHAMTFSSALKDQAFWGRMVESAIGAHLLNQALRDDFRLSYWREGNAEVDFVISNGKAIAMEVKSGKGGKTAGMAAFEKKFRPEKLLLLGNEGLNWKSFLKLSYEDLFS